MSHGDRERGVAYQWDIVQLARETDEFQANERKESNFTIENAAILAKRLEIETARGVLRVIRRKGITGKGAQYFSTAINNIPEMKLAVKRPYMSGCDQGISSVVLRLNPRRRQPTVPTRVRDPRTSMRRSFS